MKESCGQQQCDLNVAALQSATLLKIKLLHRSLTQICLGCGKSYFKKHLAPDSNVRDFKNRNKSIFVDAQETYMRVSIPQEASDITEPYQPMTFP